MRILQRFAEDGTPLPPSALDVPALLVPLTDQGLAMVAAHVRDAVELMHSGCGNARGVAMAFPQIGVSLAAFVFCPTGARGTERVFVNPGWRPAAQIHGEDPPSQDPDVEGEERCLSVMRGAPEECIVPRHREIDATYVEVDRWWRKCPVFLPTVTVRMTSWPARVFQHCCDHLVAERFGGCVVAERRARRQGVSRG